jgi:hypothetical protein
MVGEICLSSPAIKTGDRLAMLNPLERQGRTIPAGTVGRLKRVICSQSTGATHFLVELETGLNVQSAKTDFGPVSGPSN